MNQNKMRIVAVTVAGILIVACLAACGEMNKSNINTDPDQDAVGDVSLVMPDELTTLPSDESEYDLSEPAISDEPSQEDEQLPDESPDVTETSDITDEVEWMKTEAYQKIVDTSITMLGVPFKQGGDNPTDGFDSSGFIYYCVNQAQIDFPRNLKDQLKAGEWVSYSELAPGDIVYFSAEEGGNASFGGVYVGGGLMIYSPVPDDCVKTANITTNYWVTHFVTGLRVCNAEN